MQKTNFSYEILLRDDASSDGTTEICRKYAVKYPSLINLLMYEKNQFIKGIKPFVDNVKRARGKYIALCEGDDYWTDPFKLQKQVDYMEANNHITLSYHKVKKPNMDVNEDSYKIKNDLSTAFIPTCSVVFVNNKEIINNIKNNGVNIISGDQYLFYLCSFIGELKFMDFTGGVYNQTEHGMSKSIGIRSKKWLLNRILMYSILLKVSPIKNKFALIKVAQSSLFNAMDIGIISPFIAYPYHAFKIIVLGFLFYPKYTLFRIKSLKKHRG
tara:strand:- start:256 stop:1065 length:810 start_codon:yes stop_codon:yes gene_type:complete